ncbi:ssDNA-binding protein [Paramagnetospirillum magneticum]|uniref:Uncharacterized protein n=1 Tax=Paramagnetospirillum magneticum (strain ATCC 700264 / AMB-1) TaxID=342108 RepID=Q2W3Q2_PARM1|nr:ssDNA-binding protein [Paramagnetospirillum magneticum]BAE51523.1 hypothetical protein amb2719 [Paramagnetospirillum magneticum AMB-1]
MADKYTYSATAKTPLVRAAFFRGVEPEVRTNDKGVTEKTWGLTAIAPAGSDLTGVKAAIVEAATKMWGSTAGDKLKHPKFKSPLKDGATQVDKAARRHPLL